MALSPPALGLDVLVNNAGIMFTDGLEGATEEQVDQCMNANLKSALILTQAAIQYLEQSGMS